MTRISVSDSAATPDAGRCIAVLGRDISCTGIGVVSSVPIALGTRLRVELPRVSGEVDCYDAIVNRCRPVAEALFDVGAVFVEAIPVTQYVVIT